MTSASSNPPAAPALYSGAAFNETAMLARIGSELRNLYGDVEDAGLPGDLLYLASLIDGKREAERAEKSSR